MRIEYRILWVDDAPEWVESQVDNVKEYLADFGFVLKADIKSSYKGIDFSQYDIIAIDYDLSDEEEGIDALSLIRDEDVYTEILFYSQYGEPKLREEIKNNRVDGVYCASRESFLEKMKKLIDTTIRKTQEINNLRGLVMAETSAVDNLIKVILLKSRWTEEHFMDRHAEINKFHNGKRKELGSLLPFDVKNVAPFIHGHFVSNFSFKSLKKFITKNDWDDIKEYRKIMLKRNFLAHGTEISNSLGKIVLEKNNPDGSTEILTLTSNDFIELRKKIKEFREKFEKFLS